MKALLLTASLALIATSCQQSSYVDTCDPDVVGQQYVHKYGVTVSKDDWETRGRNGQIVNVRKDGVTVSHSYEDGELQGETTYSFPNSKTIQRVEFYDAGVVAKETTNYSSGMPQKEQEYVGGESKIVTLWYESGAPQRIEEYEEDRIVTGKYYNEMSTIESEVTLGSGLRIRRDAYGQLLSNDTVQDGMMTRRTNFHPNGTPSAVTPYIDGIISGERRTYHPGGEPSTLEEWIYGEQHGTTTVFRNGEKISEVPYINGLRNGVERRFRQGMIVEQEVTWKDDQMHGPARSYVGQDVNTDWYHSGKAVSRLTYEQLDGVYR